jgi:phage repressor protein C with HTH and peptisase S24 domain
MIKDNVDKSSLKKGEEFKYIDKKNHQDNQLQPVGTATKARIAAEGIPLIPLGAMAGFGVGDTQVMDYECERYVVPAFREAEFLIPVKGSSMYPKYSSGDIVACKKLPVDTFFQWSKVYVLDTEQGALIKRIKRGSDDEHLMIVSENEKYEPFELHRSSIRAVALVVGVIRLE